MRPAPSNEELLEACEAGTYVDEAQEDRRATEWNADAGRWQIPDEVLEAAMTAAHRALSPDELGADSATRRGTGLPAL